MKLSTLRSHEIYWHDDDKDVKLLLQSHPELMTKEQLIDVLLRVDQRLIQLWDKVSFERSNDLVNYTQIKGLKC